VIDNGIGDRVPGKIVDVIIKIGIEDIEHPDKFLDREFLCFFCLVLERIDIDLVDPPVYGISRKRTDQVPGFFCRRSPDEQVRAMPGNDKIF
jgi:hypothetical protein